METAKAALTLFMRSLPVGSKFSIVSFGSNYEYMQIGGKTVIEYNDTNSKEAIAKISTFSANFGGTDILRPLTAA